MTHVMKASSTADLLAMVPHLLGYRPRNSIVLVTFRGSRSCGAARFDLPAHETPRVQRRIVTSMVGMVCKIPAVDAIVIAVFTDEGFAHSSEAPHQALAAMVERRIEQSGFELRQSLCQAPDGWASYLDDDTPAGGRPLAEIEASEIARDMPPRLGSGLGTVDPHAELLPIATEQERAAMSAALDRLDAAMEAAAVDRAGRIPGDLLPLEDLPSFVERVLAGDPGPDQLHLLAFAVQGPPVRDHVMLQWASDRATGMRLWPSAGVECADLLFGHGPLPDLDRVVRGIELLRVVASRVSGRRRLPMLCMLGWLNWAVGRGTLAARYIDAAIAIDRSYGMAEVLGTLLGSGMQPGWLFRPVSE